MSNDGNKSTKRAPFTMFSSSAGGGYLDSFHTNFSGGVEINNLHTDVYGSYRNPPAQGPFNDDLVGGLSYRHQDVGSTLDRQEGFLISAQTGSIAITQTGRVQVYRDEYAKRPVNIRNIKDSSLGNYDMEYEVVQIAGRTLNPRHFVEFPEQYTTDYPLHKGTENPVFNVLDTDGNPETGSLSNYTLPDLTSSTDNFVFVNKFSSPGDRYTMSRGFLNPKGEEFSAYNASPFRNLSVRAELSENLTTHNSQFSASFHPVNRNPNYGLIDTTVDSDEFVVGANLTVAGTTVTNPTVSSFTEHFYSQDGSPRYAIASATWGSGNFLFSLNDDPPTDADFHTLNFAWFLIGGTGAVIYESDVSKGTFSASPTDVFSIVYDGNQVRYLQNGIVQRTVELDAPVKLYFDSALGGPSQMTDVSFSYLRTDYDNANVSHAVPQNSLQYTWIKDSAETTMAEFQGYATGSDIQFYSNSVGFDSPMNNVYIDPVNATQSFDFTGSAYTYGTWKEIRGGELGLSRHYRNHNILPVTNDEDDTTQYIEPPVVAKHQPLDYNLAIDNTLTPYSVKSPYGNTLMRYSNDDINKLYDFRVSDKNTEYAKIKDLYLNESVADAGNPVKAFYSLTYGEAVYPQSKNAFTNKVRVRGNYTEVAGTGSNGYDRLYGTQNTFYSTTKQRTDGSLNSQGYAAGTSLSAKVYQQDFQEGTEWANYSSKLGRDNTSGVVLDSVSGSYCFVFGGQQNCQTQTRYLQFKDTVVGNFTASFEAVFGDYTPLDLSGSALGSGPKQIHLLSKPAYLGEGTHRSWTNIAGTNISPGIFTSETIEEYFSEPTNVAIGQVADNFADYHDQMFAIKNLKIEYTPAVFKNSNAFQPMGTSGVKSFHQSASFDKDIGELNSDSDTTIGCSNLQPSLSFFEETNLTINNIVPDPAQPSEQNNDRNTQATVGYNERLIEEISSQEPFYESYESYAENEKPMLKEASILPEFRISEHMDYYVADKGGNFRSKNKNFLTLLGATVSASAPTAVSVDFDKDFEQDHLLTGEIENIKKIKEDHIGHSKTKNIRISAKGIKKLLPYNGFYPDTRTVQIGAELSSSLSSGIKSYIYSSSSIKSGENLSSGDNSGYFGFLKTMNSPGILYNSIKSGLSVDYPLHTSPPELENRKFECISGDMQLKTAPDLRVPFESLYNLDQFYPKEKSLYPVFTGDKLQDKRENSPFYFQWDGTKKPSYELAMHNFLAESVQFFLKGSSLNAFISKPETKFLEVEAGKKYCMDVVLDDRTERDKFLNIKGEAQNFPLFKSQLTSSMNERVDYGHSTDVTPDGRGGYYAINGAPKAPFVGDETGRIFLTHVDSSGALTTLYNSEGGSGLLEELGGSVTVCSGSTGVYFAAAALEYDSSAGKVFYYKYTDAGGVVALTDSSGAPTVGTSTRFGAKLASIYDDESSNVYFAIMDAGNDNVANSIGLHLNYVPVSPGTTVSSAWQSSFDDAAVTSFGSMSPDQYLGIDLKKLSFPSLPSSDRIIFAASSAAYSNGGNLGAVTFRVSDGTAAPTTRGPYVDLQDPTAGGFGASVSVCPSGINGASYYGYIAVGRAFLAGGYDAGSVALYFPIAALNASFALNSTDNLLNGRIESLGPASNIGFGYFGRSVSLEFEETTQELNLFVANDFWSEEIGIGDPAPSNQIGIVEQQVFPLKYNDYSAVPAVFPTGTLKNFIKPTFDTAYMNSHFGYAISTASGSNGLLLAASAPDYSSSFSAGGISHVLYSSASYQDYKQDGKLYGHPVDGYYDPSYCAYTSPGFYGAATARISYSSSIGGPVTLEEIFANAEVENLTSLSPDRQRTTTGSTPNSLSTLQATSKMNVSSSISLFDRVINPGVEFSISEDGEATKADRAVPSGKSSVQWAISTKYECPVVNVTSSEYEQNYSSLPNANYPSASFPELNNQSFDPPQSTWTSYSDTTSAENYEFILKESFTKEEVRGTLTGSLVELCGFTAGTKNVGTVADTKTITEAIMVVPYTERAIGKKTTEIENKKHFFRLNAAEMKRQKKSLEDNGYAVSEDKAETSISKMIKSMNEYVIPPQYNFLKYKDIKPFACYFLEFEHTLTNQDLVNIWQGISPEIATTPELDDSDIAHDIDKHNFFHNIDIPNDIKFMVFKVKKKAEWNYYNITTDSTDDDRFRFDFQGNGQVEVVPEYSYNWPYDFFSLIERAEVSVDFTLKKPEEDE